MTDQWCILRMAGPRTLAVAESLTEAGFEVWTPVGGSSKRPRTKARKEIQVPVMPTYVFARDRHLIDLMLESSNPSTRHPSFSIFRWDGRIPLIADASLEYLRRGEERYLRRMKEGKPMRSFSDGETVKITNGGFAGMSGVVEQSNGKYCVVCFPGFSTPIRVSKMILLSEEDMQARAA